MTTRSSSKSSAGSVKHGIHEDSANRNKIAEVLKFNTSKSGDDQVDMKEHVDRMQQGDVAKFAQEGS